MSETIVYIDKFNEVAAQLKTATAHAKNKSTLANELAWQAARIYALGTPEERTQLKASVSKDAQFNFAKSYVSRAKKVVLYFIANEASTIKTASNAEVTAASLKLMLESEALPSIALHSIAKAVDELAVEKELTEQELCEIGRKILELDKEDLQFGGATAINACVDAAKAKIAGIKEGKQAKQLERGVAGAVKAFNALNSEEKVAAYEQIIAIMQVTITELESETIAA